MVEGTKMMCAPPLSVYGPHYDPGVVININEIARRDKGILRDKLFPVGSIIVKKNRNEGQRTVADQSQS